MCVDEILVSYIETFTCKIKVSSIKNTPILVQLKADTYIIKVVISQQSQYANLIRFFHTPQRFHAPHTLKSILWNGSHAEEHNTSFTISLLKLFTELFSMFSQCSCTLINILHIFNCSTAPVRYIVQLIQESVH